MAVVLESIRIPHSSGFRTTLAPSPMASSVSAISSVQKISSLPEFRGLRIQLRSQRRTLTFTTSRNERIIRPRSRIVSEAQETTLEVPAVTDKSWESLVLKADLVLVEFWASWCGPCRMIHPVVSELSKQYAGKLKCYKLNTDDCPSIATQYGIRSIPTVMIFKNGEKKDAIIGAVPKTTLTNSIDKFV